MGYFITNSFLFKLYVGRLLLLKESFLRPNYTAYTNTPRKKVILSLKKVCLYIQVFLR